MSLRILIADDEALMRKNLEELLHEMGYTVVASAEDGDEALRLFESSAPDIGILDIEMPGKTGLEVAKRISQRCPVILLTAYSDPELVREAKDIGVMAYLTKPFRQNEIAPAIELAARNFLKISNLSDRVEKLKRELETRKQVERAKGLLMERKKMTESGAYQHMRTLSMRKSISMKRVAEAIILTLE